MPISIEESQVIQLDNGFVGGSGSFNFREVTTNEISALLIERAELFKEVWLEQLNSKKLSHLVILKTWVMNLLKAINQYQ